MNRRNLDEQLDALEEREFMDTIYPEPGWTKEEIEEFETRKEPEHGRPSRKTE